MKNKNIIGIPILIILLITGVLYVNNNVEKFQQLSIENPLIILILIPLIFIHIFFTGKINGRILRPFNVFLTFMEEFQLAVINRFYNYLTIFRGGVAVRAVYLKKRYKFPYTDFLATLLASYILIFLVAGIIGIISTFGIFFTTNILSWEILIIFSVIVIVMLFIIIFAPKFKERENIWINRIIRVVNGWHIIRNNREIIVSVVCYSFLQIIFYAVIVYFQFLVFGIHITFIKALFLSSITGMSILLSITPANLGINEAIIVFSANTINITTAESLSAALLGRLISILILFIVGPIFSYLLIKK